MAALTNDAYTAMRTNQVMAWYMEIRDDLGAAVLRVDSSDPRLTVTDDNPSDTVSFVLILSGDDAEVTLPTTVNGSILYDSAVGGLAMTAVEAFTNFTLGAADDEVTITHTVVLPAP